MSKLNTRRSISSYLSPIRTEGTVTGRTYEGAPGYARDVKGELFTLGVSLFAGEATFYESAADRNTRFVELVRQATVTDPVWTADFLRWLRAEGNIRTASIMGGGGLPTCQHPVNYWSRSGAGAVCLTHAGPMVNMAEIRPRCVVDSVCQRADEPGELVAYWLATYGRALPMPVKRGVADAMVRMGTQRNYLKYDSAERGVRWADVLNLAHPKPRGENQDHLFGYATTVPYVEGLAPTEDLVMLSERASLMAVPVERRRSYLDLPGISERFRVAGITWEALAGWLQGPMDAKAWEAIIPTMGYMALLRNLRNFDAAGVSDKVADAVARKLADPIEVSRSRQFPYRFLSAYLAAPSDRWSHTLGRALDHAVLNIPKLTGSTLILCDMSGSMDSALSDKSQMTRVQAAALFSVALAQRCGFGNVDLVGYASGHFVHSLQMGGSVLKQCERFTNRIGEKGYATYTEAAITATYGLHSRVIVFTDEQSHDSPELAVPAHIPFYTFNLGGYKFTGHGAGGAHANRHTLAGLSDATFRMIPLLEDRANGRWPWEDAPTGPALG
jgi:hypothetical protein